MGIQKILLWPQTAFPGTDCHRLDTVDTVDIWLIAHICPFKIDTGKGQNL